MKILIIDDDMALLKTLEMLFAGMDHDVIAFHDPYAACEYIRTGPVVDTLIVDYMMPAMSGEDFLKRVKKYIPARCRIILISGYTDKIETLDLKKMGVTTFLPKPLDLDNLYRAIGAEESVNG